MDTQTAPENVHLGQVAALRRVVEQLRLNLYTLEEQAAFYGPLDVPLHLKNAVEEATRHLAQKEAELRELHRDKDATGNLLAQSTELMKFWGPFVTEGARFVVPHEAPLGAARTKVKVLALTMQAIFNMYRLLLEQFAGSYDINRIRLEVTGAIKDDLKLERMAASTYPHLIVYGAPGANPLSNYLLAQFKGISPDDSEAIVRQGYVFRVSGDYLGNPFIVSDGRLKRYSKEEQEAMQELGIYDLKPGHPPQFFPRTFEQYNVPSYKDQDCAITVTGWATLPGENRIRRVVIVAGHSRHSSVFSTAFVVTNEEWGKQVNSLPYSNTETIIGLQPDPSGVPVAPTILAGPREIQKQA